MTLGRLPPIGAEAANRNGEEIGVGTQTVMLPTSPPLPTRTLQTARTHARTTPLHPLGRRTHAVPDAEVVASTAGPGHEGPGPHRMQAYPHQGYAPFGLLGQLMDSEGLIIL